MKSRWLFVLACLPILLSACGNDSPLPLVGTLERDRIELVADAQEPITRIAVHEGETVQPGQLILQLDDRRTRAQLQEATASRSQAMAHVQAAQATLLQAKNDFSRTQSLVKHGTRTPSDLDAARAALDNARANLDAARASLTAAQASIDNLDITLQRLSVRAPRAATVDSLPYHLGETPPIHGVIAVLLDNGTAYAQLYVPEALRNKIHPRLQATVHFDGLTRDYPASVHFISSDAAFTPYYALTERDRGRLSYLAKVYLDAGDNVKLPVGAPVTVDFPALHH
jgi:HlyD family secretion protein